MAGYHVAEIPKGVLGEASKIEEEFLEFKDALDQGNSIMALLELSDLLGAVCAYLDYELDGAFKLEDLIVMMKATQRAFETGHRKCT